MKYDNKKKPKNNQQKRKGLHNNDSFFSSEMNKRRKNDTNDHIIDSSSSEEEDSEFEGNNKSNGNGIFVNGEEEETVQEKRQRLAKAYLEKQREILRKEKEDEDEDEQEKEYEKDGERDSLVVDKLLKAQLEDSGRLRRAIASRVEKPESVGGFEVLSKHRQSVTAVCLSDDDSKGFSASKDGVIKQWDVDTGKAQKYQWPNDETTLRLHGVKSPDGRATKHSKQVLALALSTDGRYLASGGLDRHVHIWDTRTAQHIQAFPGHRGPVSSLTFRQGTSELFSGSFDRSIKIWSVDDRAYVNTLFGHQSEVLTVDCLRKERVLAAGRDRTMQMFKVPEESRLIFRSSASSLECCCFIDNDEFLSGSDNGNIELWGVQKKKPVYIVKNAHAVLTDPRNLDHIDDANLSNGRMACSWVSSVAVCRGSDLAASGAGNGFVRLWALDTATKGIQPLFDIPLVGFVNSLAFAKSGRFLVAGVGQEPRLGRWGRVSDAQNGVAIQRLKLL